MHSLTSMLKYKRKPRTDSIKDFSERFLHPTFGFPDKHGNYELIVGKKPKICYAAHYDTVHSDDGMQNIQINNQIVTLANGSKSNCLGADCATGIWLILEMIDAGIEGVYVVHAEEEGGCIGSSALVASNPKWLQYIKAVISFDRKDKESIITHQMGMRTCSDAFAVSLDKILGLGMRPDTGGSYTDSNEYASLVSECTNISVGYFAQHTSRESQDLQFASDLRDALIDADWSQLEFVRDPSVIEYDYGSGYGLSYGRGWQTYVYESDPNELDVEPFLDLVKDHPEPVARMLADYFSTHMDLLEELYEYGLRDDDKGWLNRWLR